MNFEFIEKNEPFINNIDVDYFSDDTKFNGFIYKLNTPELIKVN